MSSFKIESVFPEFINESRENLDEMVKCLLKLEKDHNDRDSLNALFRAVHTIKGSSGMFNMATIEKFTHGIEFILDLLRKDETVIDSTLISQLLKCNDHIEVLIDYFDKNPSSEIDISIIEQGDFLIDSLNWYLPGGPVNSIKGCNPEKDENCKVTKDPGENNLPFSNDCWHVSLRFGEDIFKNGMDPQTFIAYLVNKSGVVGELVYVIPVYDNIPHGDDMDPEKCYLGFEIEFKGDTTKEAIEEVFEFVWDDCLIKIIPPNSSISEYIKFFDELPEEKVKMHNLFMETGSLTLSEMEEVLKLEKNLLKDNPTEDNLNDTGTLEKVTQNNKSLSRSNSNTMRINADKIDSIINLVGELVISSAGVREQAERNGDTDLKESVESMIRLVEDVRDSTMATRMVQIGEMLSKFERIVRDLSKKNNKEIDFLITGSDTELDKILIEKINDPLMHIIRNAVDHGIETADEREKKGKPRNGAIRVNAYHETGNVVIEITDDGKGLNREIIIQKAVEKGLIEKETELSDEDLYELVFLPGFSTKEQVTSTSGRGVGMDVVKRNIESLRGTVTIQSSIDAGTTMKIHLPLTLAIIEGFQVTVGNNDYVIPLDRVLECGEISHNELRQNNGGNYVNIRGEIIPFMELREFFGIEKNQSDKSHIVIVETLKKKAGLVVDGLKGEFQAVVKPLRKIFQKLDWVTGSTILGNGDVALILDVPKLVKNSNGK